MTKKDILQPIRAQYDIARHHAWAGTVLLSVLLAIRIIFEMAENRFVPDFIFISLGLIIVLYTLGALFFTFRYRNALLLKEQEKYENRLTSTQKLSEKQIKQQYKIEKKKAKNQLKKEKKSSQ